MCKDIVSFKKSKWLENSSSKQMPLIIQLYLRLLLWGDGAALLNFKMRPSSNT